MSTLKKISCGLCCVGAGIAMIAYIGLGQGLGTAVGFAVEGIARQPEAAMQIIMTLVLTGVIPILFLGILAFIVAIKLISIAKHSCHSDC